MLLLNSSAIGKKSLHALSEEFLFLLVARFDHFIQKFWHISSTLFKSFGAELVLVIFRI